ncbi:MAG: HD-GYP domain-containing protein [Planctomycetota bacterium]|jgi:putative nucleotidyltransferase with HDIG domain
MASSKDIRVLVVDDEPDITELVRKGLQRVEIECFTANDPVVARDLLCQEPFAVLISDIAMPKMTGLDLLMHTRQNAPSCRVVLMTGLADSRCLADALNLGAYDYLQKPFDLHQLVDTTIRAATADVDETHLAIRAARAMQMEAQIRQASLESIRALVHAVEAKDRYTRRHSEQVRFYSVNIAEFLGADGDLAESIRVASLLHDIGKIGIPDHILTKAGRLTAEEFEQVQKHPSLGAEILDHISMLAGEARLIRHHHEHWDGQGYPDGLSGVQIPLGARIICVADSIDAMLMRRTYKEPFPVEKVADELLRCCGGHFDPDIAHATVEWVRSHPHKLILPQQAA